MTHVGTHAPLQLQVIYETFSATTKVKQFNTIESIAHVVQPWLTSIGAKHWMELSFCNQLSHLWHFKHKRNLQFKIHHWRSVALLTLSIKYSGKAITCLLLDCKYAIEREWRPYCKKWNKVMLQNQTILHWMSIKGFDFFIWFLWIEKGISLWIKN